MKVAIYARVSTKDKGQSTENQLPDLRRFAAALGYSIYKEYVEEESGGTGNRSEFKALFADAHRKKFDLVLFWSLDRFSREGALPTLQYLNQLESWGVGYKSLTEQYLDSTGLFKDAIISILATLAKQERVRLSERTKAGMARKVAQGVKMGPPSKSPEQIEQVRRLKGEGMSNYAIGKAMGMSASTVAKYVAG
ncbi:recombinase family protein [Hymenobacter negativus]|uniref:Recombinase family protein n=1 Tax=Hymenobacter negativus TaxID=2795026 RepID=A0ABS0QAZ6_9BACT|nr:recombinase family protein [Hymenobacter negativus]MBH8559861.1 recombinase family protein [Hymenobacter negativus]